VLADIYPELETFIGDLPSLGKTSASTSVSSSARGFKSNPIIDTYEMAAVLMPSAPRYNLGSLSYQLGVVLSDAHRASTTPARPWRLQQALQKLNHFPST
jgi:DNA polymerase-3 subunit epsilon/ATP-dependent DNA helicase DinG